MPRRPLALLFALATIAPACSYTFTDEQPTVELRGPVPSLEGVPRLNRAPATSGAGIIQGYDKAYWTYFTEARSRIRVVRLKDPPAEQVYEPADQVTIRYRAFYIKGDLQKAITDKKPLTLDIVEPGLPVDKGVRFELPAEPHILFIWGPNDEYFMFWPTQPPDPKTAVATVYRRDLKSKIRDIPLPAEVDPASPYTKGQYAFSWDGARVVIRDGREHVWVHELNPSSDRDLGPQADMVYLDDNRKVVFTVGNNGVRAVPIDGKPPLILDPTGADSDSFWLDWTYGYYLLPDSDVLRRVKLDGSAPPEVLDQGHGLRRVLDIGPDDQLVYSTDPWGRYAYGAGDGWIGSWRFMERGLSARFSTDGKRLRWVERAAQQGGIGDLYAVDLSGTPPGTSAPATPPSLLSRNVRQWDELRDGRLLVVENHAQRGVWNRLVTIDEKTRTAQWVCPGAHQWRYVPSSNDVLVDVISTATAWDIVRMPIPPKPKE